MYIICKLILELCSDCIIDEWDIFDGQKIPLDENYWSPPETTFEECQKYVEAYNARDEDYTCSAFAFDKKNSM